MNLQNHPAFEGIDKNFLISMDRTLNSLKGKDPTQVMAAIMSIMNEAKRYNVQLTPERQKLLIGSLRNSLPRDKRAQFDMFLQMMEAQQKRS